MAAMRKIHIEHDEFIMEPKVLDLDDNLCGTFRRYENSEVICYIGGCNYGSMECKFKQEKK